MSFFEELKRRNVFRVGVAYLVSAWVLLQVVDLVLENIQAPDWVMKVFMLALAIGFPLAVFFAWAFEMTPDGIRKEKDVDRSQSIASQTGRKLDRSIIVILLVAVVYFAWDNFSPSTSGPKPGPEATQQVAIAEQTAKSIAVLPFTDLSQTGDQEFFSDGIAEEILNVLASIPDLKVAARTSAFTYKGTDARISEIAKELGVNYVLEGSVRKSGNQVRVTAQLIKADDGFHLWSANYDRELTNIFAIQDEIAASIADALKVSLELERKTAGNLTGTRSIEAYEHYLKGMSLWHQRTVESLYQAIDEFNTAISLDPDFAKAYAGLALTWSVFEGYLTINPKTSQEKAFNAAQTALTLDPDNVEALTALGNVAKDRFNYSKAIRNFEKAIKLNPSFATAYQWMGGLLLIMGDPDAALAGYQKARSLDPRSRITGNNLALTYYLLDRRPEAVATAQEVIAFAPDFPEISRLLMHLALSDGDCESVIQHGNRLAAILNKEFNATPIYNDLCQSADPELRASAIETILSWPSFEFSATEDATLSYPEDIVMTFVDLGMFEPALVLAEKHRDYYYHIILTRVRSMRSANGKKFYCDPRLQALFGQTEIPPIEGANICD